jgi:hypothetical protein
MKKVVTMILMVLATTMVGGGQDLAHYKRVIKELSSAKYQGRGYEPVFRQVCDFVEKYSQ